MLSADISSLGSGDLVGSLPADGAPSSEWWPFRNQFLLTVGAMKCYSLGVSVLMLGAVASDSMHTDGTIAFIEKVNEVFQLQEGNLQITAPGIDLSPEGLVGASGATLDLLSWAHSCHVSEFACGSCRGCRKHYDTMVAAFGIAY